MYTELNNSIPNNITVKYDKSVSDEVIFKKIVIIGEELAGRTTLFNQINKHYVLDLFSNNLTQNNTLNILSNNNSTIANIQNRFKIKNFNYNKKFYTIQVIETSGYEENTSKLDLNNLSSKIYFTLN
jgi:hypothetical protein